MSLYNVITQKEDGKRKTLRASRVQRATMRKTSGYFIQLADDPRPPIFIPKQNIISIVVYA